MNKIYFDHAATTPVDPEVLQAMRPYFSDKFGNASSLHTFGQEAMEGVDKAREQVADFLGCSPLEVIFTSGATEADNLAIQGVVAASKVSKPHIITSVIEHPAVLEVCRSLARAKRAEISYVKVNKKGLIEVEEVKKLIQDNTILVTIMYVNNEIGTIQPIAEIGQLISKINKIRKTNKIYLHTDAVQALNYLDCQVNKLKVDLLSLSGHKIYGPKGVGALYVRQGTLIKPIQKGGHQEYGLRPGTLNTPLIVGLGKAVQKLGTRDSGLGTRKIKKLRDRLMQEIIKKIPNVLINGDLEKRVPNNLNISFLGTEGESLMLMLDMEGIAVSTGSACASGSLEPSHVLLALGLKHLEAHGSLRITLGKKNTEQEINQLLKILPRVVEKLRIMAPKVKN
jgi:cysteine desulfurase